MSRRVVIATEADAARLIARAMRRRSAGGFLHPFSFWKRSGSTPPALSSLNFTLTDTLGGDSITITGTNLGSATGCFQGGSSCTITGNTSTTLTFTSVAKSAGSYGIQVQTAAGLSNTLSLESWSPATDPGCTLLAERPNYVVSGTGTWTTRVAANFTQSTSPPTAVAGAPEWTGTENYLENGNAIGTYLTASAGTVAVVANSTRNSGGNSTSAPYDNDNLIANAGQGTFGLWFADFSLTDYFGFHAFDATAYRVVFAAAAQTNFYAVVGRYDNTQIGVSVNNGTEATATMTGSVFNFTGNLRLGNNWNGAKDYHGTMKAIACLNARATSTFIDKFHRWGQVRHGV